MNNKILLTALTAFTFTACTNYVPSLAPSETTPITIVNSYENASDEKTAAYDRDMRTVGLSTRQDPKYKSFGFKTTEEKIWFRDLTYAYWHRDITKNQFISKGLAKYPTHRYEFNFVADGFLKV
jgi:hypothetical protein